MYRDLEQREAKIWRLVDANIIGIFIWEREGAILEANDAFLRMVQLHSQNDHTHLIFPFHAHNTKMTISGPRRTGYKICYNFSLFTVAGTVTSCWYPVSCSNWQRVTRAEEMGQPEGSVASDRAPSQW